MRPSPCAKTSIGARRTKTKRYEVRDASNHLEPLAQDKGERFISFEETAPFILTGLRKVLTGLPLGSTHSQFPFRTRTKYQKQCSKRLQEAADCNECPPVFAS